MSIEALKVIVGIIFAILGLAILIRLKKLSKSKYYRYLFLVTAILLIDFGIYLATNSLYHYV